MSSLSTFQQWHLVNVTSILGPRFKEINMFYSSPDYYTKMKYDESKDTKKHGNSHHKERRPSSIRKTRESPGTVDWKIKNDDFFPYSDCPHCFWTGYFTSRTAFKRLERVGSSFLLAARQIESVPGRNSSLVREDRHLCSGRRCRCDQPLYDLEDAMGVVQHHDAVSGTAKQHVSDDYSKRVQAGINKASEYTVNKLKRLLAKDVGGEELLENLSYCQLINETICEVSQVRLSRLSVSSVGCFIQTLKKEGKNVGDLTHYCIISAAFREQPRIITWTCSSLSTIRWVLTSLVSSSCQYLSTRFLTLQIWTAAHYQLPAAFALYQVHSHPLYLQNISLYLILVHCHQWAQPYFKSSRLRRILSKALGQRRLTMGVF